jgi:hypothetical protein
MTTSAVLGLVGGLLILIGLVGGGFSFSGTTMPTVSKVVRIPCFVIGGVLVFAAIALAFRESPGPNVIDGGGTPTRAPSTPTGAPSAPTTSVGIVQAAGGGVAYVYQFPALAASKVGALVNGAKVVIQCTSQGDTVTRSDGVSSSLWDRIGEGYIPDVNVYTGTDQPTMPSCSSF